MTDHTMAERIEALRLALIADRRRTEHQQPQPIPVRVPVVRNIDHTDPAKVRAVLRQLTAGKRDDDK